MIKVKVVEVERILIEYERDSVIHVVIFITLVFTPEHNICSSAPRNLNMESQPCLEENLIFVGADVPFLFIKNLCFAA